MLNLIDRDLIEYPLIDTEVEIGNQESVKRFGEKFRKLKAGKYIVRILRWKQRSSDAQRRKYFATLRVICKITGDEPIILHEWVKRRVLAKTVRINLVGEDDVIAGSTKDLTMEQYSELIQTIITLAEDKLGLIIDPQDTIYEVE